MRPSVTGGYQLTTAARIAKERLGVEFLQAPFGGGWAKCVRHDCNMMKRSSSQEDFLLNCKLIVSHRGL